MYPNLEHQNISQESTPPPSSLGIETPTNVPPIVISMPTPLIRINDALDPNFGNRPPLLSDFIQYEPIQRETFTIAPLSCHPIVTYSKTNSFKPKGFTSKHHPLLLSLDEIVSTCYNQDIKHLHWHQAICEDFNALLSKSTWSLVPLPANHTTLGVNECFDLSLNLMTPLIGIINDL